MNAAATWFATLPFAALTALPFAATVFAFAVAGWAGTFAGEWLCAGRAPYDDGPDAVTFRRTPFATIGGGIGLALAVHGESPAHLAVLALVTLALAGGAAADLTCGALPDALTVGPLVLVVAAGAVSRDWAPAAGAFCIALPFAVAALVSHGRGMGWGDVKLAALGGALLGVADATLAFALAALAASVIARRTAGVRRPIAFGPYLAASIAASLTIVRTI
jgi:prepilin signal peptidase PulO-like enzyme (type II secretory pathway)